MAKSPTMCMLPWLHSYVTPDGYVYPCCTVDLNKPLDNIQTSDTTLEDIVKNNKQLAEIRRKMINGEKPEECYVCWMNEEKGALYSFRKFANYNFGQHENHYLENTNNDGTLNIYEPRYVDIRFSNICNFKCRQCGPLFSSTWAKEKKVNFDPNEQIYQVADPSGKVMQEVLDHIDNVEEIYWGGGEPLLMEEHYYVLDKLVEKEMFDVRLRYNTNGSVTKFKGRDFLELIKNFKNVEIQVSLDHYGKRAEWLRKGTDWQEIEKNIRKFQHLPNITLCFNTVVTRWNLLTFDEFMYYMINTGLIREEDSWYSVINITWYPFHHSIATLPQEILHESYKRIERLRERYIEEKFVTHMLESVLSAIENTDSVYGTETEKLGTKITDELDEIRGENWRAVFPEIGYL